MSQYAYSHPLGQPELAVGGRRRCPQRGGAVSTHRRTWHGAPRVAHKKHRGLARKEQVRAHGQVFLFGVSSPLVVRWPVNGRLPHDRHSISRSNSEQSDLPLRDLRCTQSRMSPASPPRMCHRTRAPRRLPQPQWSRPDLTVARSSLHGCTSAQWRFTFHVLCTSGMY